MQTRTSRVVQRASSWPVSRKHRLMVAVAAVAALAVTAVHVGVGRLPLQQATPLAPVDSVFTLALVFGVLVLAWALGSRLLRCSGIRWHNAAEQTVFSVALGLGTLAYAVLALALCHLLFAPLLAVLATLTLILLRADVGELVAILRATSVRLPRAACWRYAPVPWLVGGGVLVLVLLSLVALLPPFAYDALWYHLAAPRLFLQQHSFVVLPAIQQANFPFTVEMLYTLLLAFGSDATPAVLHLSLAVLTAFAVWSLGARYFDSRVGWLGVAGLLTASDLHKLGAIADIDLALMLFTFLALYALLVWLEERKPGWLYLAAAMAGFAIGSKYTALALLAPLCPLILFAGGFGLHKVRAGVRPLVAFLVCALLVASPWYLKNLVIFHNPLYPLLSPPYVDPGLALPPASAAVAPPEASSLASLALLPLHVLQSGSDLSLTGRSLQDYLQLPLQVYLQGDLEMYGHPSLLFLLAPLTLLVDRRPVVLRMGFVGLVLSIVWALGPQELRYLVPVFPIYALLSAVVLLWLTSRCQSKRAARLLVLLPVTMLLAVTLAEDTYLVRAMQPAPVLAGFQSKDAFLRRVVTSYSAMAYLAGVIQPGQRVLAIGESRSYYAPFPFIIDGSRDLATRVFVDTGNPEAAARLLTQAGVGYLIVNEQDIQFQAAIAPEQVAQSTAALGRFQQRYLVEVFRGYQLQVYRLTGAASAG
jgi:hypothetical protein